MRISDRQRGNLTKLFLSFAGILFATTLVGSFSPVFNLLRFITGFALILSAIGAILWPEP